jgi:hypothetical protein
MVFGGTSRLTMVSVPTIAFSIMTTSGRMVPADAMNLASLASLLS